MRTIIGILFALTLCACGSKQEKSDDISTPQNVKLKPDSIQSWFKLKYGDKIYFCVKDSDIIEQYNIASKFITEIYPKEHEMVEKKGYKSITAYIGTDGVTWVVYEKILSKKDGIDVVNYVRWTNDPLCVQDIRKEDFPDRWYKMAYITSDGSDGSVPSPFHDDNIWNGIEIPFDIPLEFFNVSK